MARRGEAHALEVRKRSEREIPLDVLLRKFGVNPFADPRLALVDELTASDLRELRARKLAAVGAEDYEYAAQLYAADKQLQQLGQEILRLDNELIAALACDEFDEAKAMRASLTWLQRDSARRKALAIAAHGDRTPVSLEPLVEGAGEEADLHLAGPISSADATLALALVDAFGPLVAAAALSANARARTVALERIGRALDAGLGGMPSAQLVASISVCVARALTAVPVHPQAVAAAATAAAAIGRASEAADSGIAVETFLASPALEALVARAADAHGPSREAVVAVGAALVEHPLLDAERAVPCMLSLCAQPASTQPWRATALSLQMLRTALWRCQRVGAVGLPLDDLAAAISRHLRHPHTEVRAAAVQAAAALHVLSPEASAKVLARAPPSIAQALAVAYALAAAASQLGSQGDQPGAAADASSRGTPPAGSLPNSVFGDYELGTAEALVTPRSSRPPEVELAPPEPAPPQAPITPPLSAPQSPTSQQPAAQGPPSPARRGGARKAAPPAEPAAKPVAAEPAQAAVQIQKHARGRVVRRLGGPIADESERDEQLSKPLPIPPKGSEDLALGAQALPLSAEEGGLKGTMDLSVDLAAIRDAEMQRGFNESTPQAAAAGRPLVGLKPSLGGVQRVQRVRPANDPPLVFDEELLETGR
ncbi:hypothetical protein T492DRAFT_915456 [Pavlovales sp. CCMP2436]|nr:hypothetical protein T492DRAFT_915456 [Pavlovales sp. CCMP2436]|mmetsp:Transcript_591/g.1536  ORF Transcript_591/g.1536 Transcript_591/m.1536 type:complete len:657 (-) Transcript_591:50-2020(-)